MDTMEMWLDTKEIIYSSANTLLEYSSSHSDGVLLASAAVFAAAAIWVGTRWKKNGEDKMARRKAYLERLTADIIGDGLFQAFYDNKISAQEYRAQCKKLGIRYNITDLIPICIHPKAVEHRVKRNIKTAKLLDASGHPIRPNIPGPKPAEVVPFPTAQRTKPRWVSKGKTLLRKTVA